MANQHYGRIGCSVEVPARGLYKRGLGECDTLQFRQRTPGGGSEDPAVSEDPAICSVEFPIGALNEGHLVYSAPNMCRLHARSQRWDLFRMAVYQSKVRMVRFAKSGLG